MSDYDVIVVGTDGSDMSLRAVDKAARIAAEAGARLIVASDCTNAHRATGDPDPDQSRNGRSKGLPLRASSPWPKKLERTCWWWAVSASTRSWAD